MKSYYVLLRHMSTTKVYEVILGGGSRIFNGGGGGHQIMDACCLYEHTFSFLVTKTKRWEVVKYNASKKDLFCFCCFMPFPLFEQNYP